LKLSTSNGVANDRPVSINLFVPSGTRIGGLKILKRSISTEPSALKPNCFPSFQARAKTSIPPSILFREIISISRPSLSGLVFSTKSSLAISIALMSAFSTEVLSTNNASIITSRFL
jgi:hypothetical protein